MSNDNDRRKEMVAAAAHAMAARNVAIATARYGYVPPERPAAVVKAPTSVASAPAPATINHDALVAEAARRRAEREAAEAAEAKASWAKVIAKMSGNEAKDPTVLQHGWGEVVAKANARHGTSPAETRATRSGWAAVIADFNSRRGR